jgi:spore maturation protein CgeB
MGCGGFLISNYQPEIPEYFVPDEDIVLYDSIPDLLAKIEFYLEHEDLRLKIAANGYEKIKKHHTWTIRIKDILDQVF